MNSGFLNQYWRVGGLCGVLFIVTFIIGAVLQGEETPMHDDPVDEIRAYWLENGNDYLLGDFIIGLGFLLLFLPFLSALRSVLGEAEGGSQMWSRLVLGGGLLFLALAAGAGLFWTTLAWGDVAANASDDTIRLLMWADVAGQHFAVAGIVAFAVPAAVAMLKTRALPIWLGVLTLILAVVAAVSMLAILSDDPDENFGWLGFPALGIWILVTSITLLLRKSAPAAIPVAGTGTGPVTASP